jgi:MFS transporter, Spinster family, sphingosine-1-phosphate transporter
MHAPITTPQQGDGYLAGKGQAWFAFALAFLLMASDFIDRQVVVTMFPYLKAEWAVSDKELGALIAAVSITIAVASLPIAFLTDRWSRVKAIVVMGVLWSLATIACGFARSYTQLLAARSLIGLGEAGYGPAGAALLASLFPQRLRATVLGGFLTAGSVGSVAGVIIGGVIGAHWGWRAAFGIVGGPGLVVALLFLLVRDYRTVALVAPAAAARLSLRRIAAELFRARSGIAAYIAGALQLITVSTVYAWLPSYLNRFYGLSGESAGLEAAIVIAAGSVGAVVWSALADRLGRRDPRYKLFVPAACGVVTLLLLSGAFGLLLPGALQFATVILGGFTMTATVGAIPAVAIDVVHPGLRASAGSMVAVVQNLFGLGLGPLITGVLSDAYGLETALAIVPFSCLLSAGVLLLGSRSYADDLRYVRTALGSDLATAPQAA